jgi:F-type H+-transporting ATPase subunit delta
MNREVHLHCELDPTLLGGAVLRAEDLVIDGSLAGGLVQLAASVAG